MKRIVILGCESSHAEGFLEHITKGTEFSDLEVAGVYSEDRESAARLWEKYGVRIMESYDEDVGELQGVMITARHGDNHLKYARPYLDLGLPMFIDKPVTITEADARELIRELSSRGIRVSGGSSLRQDVFVKELKREREEDFDGRTVGGIVRAPIQMNSIYGGFYFYAPHLIEMVCEIFGRNPKSVCALESDGRITVVFGYRDFEVTGFYSEGSCEYYAARRAEEGVHGSAVRSDEGNDWILEELREFHKLLGGADQPLSYADLTSPVFIAAAIERSLLSGSEEKIIYR